MSVGSLSIRVESLKYDSSLQYISLEYVDPKCLDPSLECVQSTSRVWSVSIRVRQSDVIGTEFGVRLKCVFEVCGSEHVSPNNVDRSLGIRVCESEVRRSETGVRPEYGSSLEYVGLKYVDPEYVPKYTPELGGGGIDASM